MTSVQMRPGPANVPGDPRPQGEPGQLQSRQGSWQRCCGFRDAGTWLVPLFRHAAHLWFGTSVLVGRVFLKSLHKTRTFLFTSQESWPSPGRTDRKQDGGKCPGPAPAAAFSSLFTGSACSALGQNGASSPSHQIKTWSPVGLAWGRAADNRALPTPTGGKDGLAQRRGICPDPQPDRAREGTEGGAALMPTGCCPAAFPQPSPRSRSRQLAPRTPQGRELGTELHVSPSPLIWNRD